MNKKAWIIFTALVVVLLGALIAFSQQSKLDIGEVNPDSILAASEQSGKIADRVKNDPSNPVTIIEYGDYQCPGCKKAYTALGAAVSANKDKVALVFRNLPLSALHPNARAAAAAAESAGQQGKFWEMHDKLYSNQAAWSTLSPTERVDFFSGYAKEIGLDITKFKADIDSEAVRDKINYDRAVFAKTKLPESTPTILMDGKVLDQDVWSNPDAFQKAIDDIADSKKK